MNILNSMNLKTNFQLMEKQTIMNQVIIRDVEEKDFAEIKEIINKTWEFEEIFESEEGLETALGIYFNQVLYGNSFGKAAILNDKVVGVIFAFANGEVPKYRMMTDDSTEYILTLINLQENERKAIYEYMGKLDSTYDELLEGKTDFYDGTLDFLIVSEEVRGLKIGKRFWNEVESYFKERNAKSIYVFTDTMCNFGFYDHIGFSRQNEKSIEFVFGDKKAALDVFLYDYNFDTQTEVV